MCLKISVALCAFAILFATASKSPERLSRSDHPPQYRLSSRPAERRIATGYSNQQLLSSPPAHYHQQYYSQSSPSFPYDIKKDIGYSSSTSGSNPVAADLQSDTNNHLPFFGGSPSYFNIHHHHQPQRPYHPPHPPPPPPPSKPVIVERPVYVKEPEPIIEIIIKESNVSLPAPPPPPPAPKKKKEQVQVFYVKYKKDPHAKNGVSYDKPVPALTPFAPKQEEETEDSYHHQDSYQSHPEEYQATHAPPTTTLRTIIKPDSETYHNPESSGIKVTFNKEGFDYAKRSNKEPQISQDGREFGGRQVQGAFGNRRPNYQSQSYQPEFGARQQYRPLNPFGGAGNNNGNRFYNEQYRQQYQKLPKLVPEQQTNKFYQGGEARQPVPYRPFESFNNNNYNHNQQQQQQQGSVVSRPQQFSTGSGSLNQPKQFGNYNNNKDYLQFPPYPPLEQFKSSTNSQNQQFVVPANHQRDYNNFNQQRQPQVNQYRPNQGVDTNLNSFKPIGGGNQQFVPPGGELVPAVPRYEQHITSFENQNQNQGVPNQGNFRDFSQSSKSTQNGIQNQVPAQHSTQFGQNYQYYNQDTQRNAYTQKFSHSTPASVTLRTTTPTTTTTTTTTTQKPSTSTKDPKVLNAQLPDEVPEDLRQQLLSSGILNNADISVLDYDKVGDIPISALPPDQLANFYGAGGAEQLAAAGSSQVSVKVKPPTALPLKGVPKDAQEDVTKKVVPPPSSSPEMKVVHYNPAVEQERINEQYLKEDAKSVDAVVLNDTSYTRYLPLRVSGAKFPVPEELRGKRISSVVILAPVTYGFGTSSSTGTDSKENGVRVKREDANALIESVELKELLKTPNETNFAKFLDVQKKLKSEKQAVILLVSPTADGKGKEIYMYDIGLKNASKLDGELSTAFVEAAEANSSDSGESQN